MAHGILVPQPGIESTILTPRLEKSHLFSSFQIGFLGALGFLRESQGWPQWSIEKSNYLQLNQSSSSFICFIYWGCAKAFVQYKDSAMGKKKKRKKIERENSNRPIIICHSVSKDATGKFFSEIFLWLCLYNHFFEF